MKSKTPVVGITLILVGLFWFLSSLGYIDQLNIKKYIDSLFELWPLFLIIMGTFIVTRRKVVRTIIVMVSIAVWILYVVGGPNILENLHSLITNGHI